MHVFVFCILKDKCKHGKYSNEKYDYEINVNMYKYFLRKINKRKEKNEINNQSSCNRKIALLTSQAINSKTIILFYCKPDVLVLFFFMHSDLCKV